MWRLRRTFEEGGKTEDGPKAAWRTRAQIWTSARMRFGEAVAGSKKRRSEVVEDEGQKEATTVSVHEALISGIRATHRHFYVSMPLTGLGWPHTLDCTLSAFPSCISRTTVLSLVLSSNIYRNTYI
jgi:hypothetical protein